jgi:hypothetical protein
MRTDRPHDPSVLRTLRRFFERRLPFSDEGGGPTLRHVVSHLMERTLARAALRAATLDNAPSGTAPPDGATGWKHHLMVAALTELRTLDA